jgi:hypothetical protein
MNYNMAFEQGIKMYMSRIQMYIPIMSGDYFEIDRLIEDLAKLYSTACATSWFKLGGNKRPSHEEFRQKVVEFMKHFEYTLDSFPQTPAADNFRERARKSLEQEITKVLAGENKDVEKRYKYYVDYS